MEAVIQWLILVRGFCISFYCIKSHSRMGAGTIETEGDSEGAGLTIILITYAGADQT